MSNNDNVQKDEHGALFDRFSRSATHSHGGSYFDTGFGQQSWADAHGALHDLFGVPRDSQAHGERFDQFGWHDMPAVHGQQFDSSFRVSMPHADGHGGHGSWYDVFRGGTQVRFMLEGLDCEGTVDRVNSDHAVVRDQGGRTHEVGLEQFLAYRTPTQEQASPGLPASGADSPSAHDQVAHGAFHGDRKPVSSEMPPVAGRVHPGAHTEPRSELPGGLTETFDHLKTLVGDLDVAKSAKDDEHVGYLAGDKVLCKDCGGGKLPKIHTSHKRARNLSCSNCYSPLAPYGDLARKTADVEKTSGLSSVHTGTWHGTGEKLGAFCSSPGCQRARPKGGGQKPMKLEVRSGQHPMHHLPCAHCGGNVLYTHAGGRRPTDNDDVGKTVDTTETATQGQPTESEATGKTVGHRNNCPRGGSAPCGASVDGRCGLCRAEVHDHDAVGKAFGSGADNQSGGQTVTINSDRTPGGSGQAASRPSGTNVDVPHREHKSTDHHSSQEKPGRCPHCGQVLEQVDERTEQGQPRRKDKQDGAAHKCIGTALDVLKTLVEA